MAAHQRSGSSPISAYRYESASEGQYALEVHRVYFGFPGNTANSACRHRGRRAGLWNLYATKETGRNIMRLAAWWRAALGTAKDGMDADFYSRFASRFFLWMRISADSGRSAVWVSPYYVPHGIWPWIPRRVVGALRWLEPRRWLALRTRQAPQAVHFKEVDKGIEWSSCPLRYCDGRIGNGCMVALPRTNWTVSWLLVVCFAWSGPAFAQMNMPGHAMEMQDEISPDQLPVPRKMTGIGNAQMQITSKSKAQMWFNQGLNLLHDFWDYESARAFEQSIRVDPRCAICYWGLYKAESFYHSTAQGYAAKALQKAVALKGGASRRERLYIEATAAGQRTSKNPGPGSNSSRSIELWRELVRSYPEDTQAQIFLAQAVGHAEKLKILES